jgi:conjugal transfer pilus assembly protein TraF
MRGLILFFSILSLFQPITLIAAEINKDGEKPVKRGYWWYEKKPDLKEEKEAVTKEPTKQRQLPSLNDYTLKILWDMHPDDFQPLLNDFQKKAVMAPTVEYVREYLTIQDIARRRARAFTNVAATVVQQYPTLSMEKDYPTVVPGQVAFQKQKTKEIQTKIQSAKNDFALLYFYSPTCEYCLEQTQILKFFRQQYDMDIRGINIQESSNVAPEFKVYGVPTLLLIRRGSKETFPIASGVVSLDTLEDRIYRGIRLMNKEITPTEYSMYEFQRGGGFDPTSILKKTDVLAE